jgi:hypothetical protein
VVAREIDIAPLGADDRQQADFVLAHPAFSPPASFCSFRPHAY